MARLTIAQRAIMRVLLEHAGKHNPYSINALAREAGVSELTVRRFINSHPGDIVSESTKQPLEYYAKLTPWVRGIAQQLEYLNTAQQANLAIADLENGNSPAVTTANPIESAEVTSLRISEVLPPVLEWRYLTTEDIAKLDKVPLDAVHKYVTKIIQESIPHPADLEGLIYKIEQENSNNG